MSAAFQSLRSETAHGHDGLLDEYGATSEAEFFAVSTEVFFERPIQLREEMPDLYHVLCRYYQQDTAARLEACPEQEQAITAKVDE
jgi:Mlc titration factor MtfA (ptsG expression regulator)